MSCEWLAQYATAAGRLIFAGICGMVIGWEREKHDKGAGLRTHMLICVGACLFALIALAMHKDFPSGDVFRVLQGILLGIGFLAGGVIFHEGTSVRGLTTAAGVWILSAVGLATGMGHYFLAGFATILSLAIISWLKRMERRWREPSPVKGSESPSDAP